MPLDWSDPAHPKPGPSEFFAVGAAAAVSPDGKWIAYADAPEGLPEIFVSPLAGGGGRWQISSAGDNPVWSRQRRELLFEDLPSFRIMSASYSTPDDSFAPSPTRRWSEIRVDQFDVMPDGKHVVMISSGEQKPVTHAMFLFNFMDDLRRRVPRQK